MVVLFPSQGCKVRLGSASTGRDWDLHVPRLCMWPTSRRYLASRGLTGAFVPRVVRSAPSPGRELPLQAGTPHRAVLLAQWQRQSPKWLQGPLPMFIPTLPSRCIILKS